MISLLLVAAMLLPVLPTAMAEELTETEPVILETTVGETLSEEEETVPQTSVETEPEQTEASDVTEPSEEPEATEATEETEATEGAEETEAAEGTEETEATESTEETEPTEATEETEPEEEQTELPYGLTGMPEGYVLTEEQLAQKEELNIHAVVNTLAGLTPGVDYVENEVIFLTESEEFAALVAASYNGTLESVEYGVAVITLQEITVLEAVTAAADLTLPLVAVSPNYITRIKPVEASAEERNPSIQMFGLPQEQSWETWVRENLAYPDEFIENPAAEGYQWMHDAVDTYEAWGVTTGGGVKVAVIDSGVQTNHPELSGKVTTKNINNLGTSDLTGHGTHVAGIIAAKLGNSGQGGAGIAPDASILSLRVFYEEDGIVGADDADVIRAINSAVDSGAWIINMSFGNPYYNSKMQEAIDKAASRGVTLVAAMGNANTNTIEYPAGYNNVIAVGATDRGGNKAHFSSYGAWADISAPGQNIMSTYPTNDYFAMDGTSMAAPVVSGVAALYMSVYGRQSSAQMEKILKANVTKVNGSGMGAGVVNAAKLFDTNAEKPDYRITGATTYNNNYKGAALVCESKLELYKPVDDEMGAVLYTTNGKTPSTKNGEIVNGTIYSGPIDLSAFSGSTVTVKAAYVSGLGIVNKVLTLKLKVSESTQVTGVTIQGPDTIVAGKKGNFAAVVAPAKADQDVTWSIVSCSASQVKAKISSKGVLSTVAGGDGTIIIRAASKANPAKVKELKVTVVSYKPIKKITLNTTSMTLNVGKTGAVSIASVVDADNVNVKNRYDFTKDYSRDFTWTSSNTKVATVNASGKITAVAKGSATITCKALDGSGKTATCKVTVKQPVTSIKVTGQTTIAPGATGKYKIEVLPSNANSKKVTWSVDGNPAGVTVSSSGAVKVDKTIATGKSFTVRATAADGSGVVGSITFKTAAKATAVRVSYSGSTGKERSVSKNSTLSTLNLFTMQRGVGISNGNNTDISAEVKATAQGNSSASFSWTSSNTKVATVKDLGSGKAVITAHSKGSAKITCTALDGSGKKTSFTVKAGTPVSGISIKTSASYINSNTATDACWDVPVVAFGKSVSNTALLGDAYGKPTTTKVTWDFTVKEYNSSGGLQKDWTNTVKNEKLVSISSSGKLSVSKNMSKYQNTYNGEFKITVKATTTDGSKLTAYQDFYAVPPTTLMYMIGNTRWYTTDRTAGEYSLRFRCNQWNLYRNQKNCGFTVTSSNPKIAGGISVEPDGTGYYCINFVVGKSEVKGTTTIKITSADGTKSCSFSFQVR